MMDLFPVKGEFPPPRDFQARAHDSLRAGFKSGHKRQMLMAPTGAGKTYLGLRVIKEALDRGNKACFVCDRTTLINQTSATADRYGIDDHGIFQADHWRVNNSRFQICSAQTIAARKYWPPANVIVVDEAHTQLKAWTEFIPTFDGVVIGLSATPFSPGLGKLFSNLVNAATMAELVELGVLVPMRVMTCTPADMRGAKTVAGEWSDKEAEARGMKIVGDVVVEWVKFGEGRKTIVFGATIAHCEELARQFNAAGIKAAVFTSHTTWAEREVLLNEYRKPDSMLRILISVEALAKGFDVPDVGCVVDCRPLRKSLSTAIQMWGRGLRSFPGKTDCIILDHSGNIVRFQEDFETIYHAGLEKLDDGEKMDKTVRKDDEEKEANGCPACGYRPFFKKCMKCGHEHVSQSMVEHHPGEMREIRIGNTKLADHPRHLWEQVVAYARQHSAPDRQRGRASHLYKDMTGSFPPKNWSVESTEHVPLTKAVSDRIRYLNIKFVKSRERQAA